MYETLGITGNRPHKLPAKRIGEIKDRLRKAMYGFRKQGGKKVIQGAALGVDTWAALAALEAGLQLHSYVPFPQQADGWREEDQEVYRYILAHSEVKIFGEERNNRLYFVRNCAIVDDSDIMLAVSSPAKDGGTYQAANYALSKGKPLTWDMVYPDHIDEKFYPGRTEAPLF